VEVRRAGGTIFRGQRPHIFEPRTRVAIVKERITIEKIVRKGIDRQNESNEKKTGATKCRRGVDREKLGVRECRTAIK
jgi:hypothetical protein